MASLKQNIEETYSELITKVSWPTWKELQTSAIIVMIASAIIAIIVLIMDTSFSKVLKFIYEQL